MAKAKGNAIRFKCVKCGTILRVSAGLAGRYIACGKCKNKIPVPHDQKEADEDMKDVRLKEFMYEVPTKCMKCHAPMSKGSAICTECGFDYREGKHIGVEDHTVKEGEEMRGKPALSSFLMDIVVVLTLSGVGVWRWMDASPMWWEMALYFSFGILFLAMLPVHLMQWLNYRDVPRREHAMTLEEDRWEREEARMPFGHRMLLVAFLIFASSFLLCLIFIGGEHWTKTKEFVREIPAWVKDLAPKKKKKTD